MRSTSSAFFYVSVIRLLLACCFFLQVIQASAQVKCELSYRRFTTQDGLPSTQIQGIFEDSKGYLWVITDRGASKYDGYNFKTYTTKEGLPLNNVVLINEDRQGQIWMMCNNGEFCYLNGDSIESYKGNEKIKKLLKDKLPGPFYFDEQGTMWITSFTGIQLFQCKGDSVQEFVPNQDAGSSTYYLRRVGEKLLALQTGALTTQNSVSKKDNLSYLLSVAGECKLACSVRVDENRWAIAGPGGFVVFDEYGNITTHFDSSPYIFSSLDHDRSGNLWMTNSNGAYLISDVNQGPSASKVFLEGHFITAILQDSQGNYWFGDRDNGLFFVPKLSMNVFRESATGKQNKIVSIKTFLGKKYYADAAGNIHEIDGVGARLISQESVPSGVTLDFCISHQGEFITGTHPCKVSISGKLVELPVSAVVRKSISLSDGRCAFALADGLAFMSQNGQWQDVPKSTFKERSNALFEDRDGSLWIGSNSGLYHWTQDSAIGISAINERGVKVSDIVALGPYMVVATRSNGLLFYNEEGVKPISETDGLLSNSVDCLEVDSEGHLWIGTGSGIQLLTFTDLLKLTFVSSFLNTMNGLPSNEVNDLLLDGKDVWIATNDGLAIVPVNEAFGKAKTLSVFFNNVRVRNSDVAIDQLENLQYDQNDLQFDFLAINFRMGSHTHYRYRLLGLQAEWEETTATSANYWSLLPGEYTFEVCAQNEDGVWSDVQQLKVVIHPHFTQTLWFKLIVVFVVLALIFFGFVLFYRNRRKQLLYRAKLAELKQQALNANMNPHFIFNALNSIQHFINSNRPMEANEYLSDFSRLIRMNLESALESAITLEEELEKLDLYLNLEKLRFGDRLSYTIVTQENINLMEMYIPPMLLQPYVENALIHGILPSERSGEVRIEVDRINEESFSVSIIDDGVGIDASSKQQNQEHVSMALKMNAERLSIWQSSTGKPCQIEIWDRMSKEQKSGTVVKLTLPFEA